MRALDVFELVQVGQDGDGLQGFSEAHLVRQNAVDAVFVVPDEPVQALELVRPHGALDDRGLHQQPRAPRFVLRVRRHELRVPLGKKERQAQVG